MFETIPMEGMKVNGDWIYLHAVDPPISENSLMRFLGGLAEHRINLSLFNGEEGSEAVCFTCCVAAQDEEAVRTVTDPIPEFKACTAASTPVGLLSIFPHRSNLKTLGMSLKAFEKAQIPVHGFCSSLSALTFIIDHADLDQASAALRGFFSLPADPS